MVGRPFQVKKNKALALYQAWPGAGVVYFARLSAERTKSRMSRIVGTPEYQLMTIRSWATTTKLLELLEDARARP